MLFPLGSRVLTQALPFSFSMLCCVCVRVHSAHFLGQAHSPFLCSGCVCGVRSSSLPGTGQRHCI